MKSWRVPVFLLIALAVVAALIWRGQDRTSAILLRDAAAEIVTVAGTDTVMITATIENAGGPDWLTFAGSTVAKMANLRPAPHLEGLPIPAGGASLLAADGAHLMLFGVEGPLEDGRLLPFTLRFAGAGTISGKATLRVADARNEEMGGAAGVAAGAATEAQAGIAMADGPPPDGAPRAVSLAVVPVDGEAGPGWRVSADAGDFRFAPASMDAAHEPGEGHAHLYVDGMKIMRMTGPEATIGALPKGRHEVRVTFNTNDHRPYVADGEPVSAAVSIEVD